MQGVKNKFFIISAVFLTILVIGRIVYSLVTGFLLPDEGLYFWNLKVDSSYPNRELFLLMLKGLSFFSRTIWDSLIIFPLVMLGFGIGTLCIVSKFVDDQSSVLAFAFLPAFFIYVPFILTETVSLFFGILAVFLISKKKYFFSSISFFIASLMRENYMIFLLGIIPYLLYKKKWRETVPFVVFCCVIVVMTFLNRSGELTYYESSPTLDPVPVYLSYSEIFFYSLRNFIIGIALGMTPFFALYLVYRFFKNRTIVAFLSGSSFYATLLFAGTTVWYSSLSILSAIVRFSSCTLLAFPKKKLSKKLILTICVSSILITAFSFQFRVFSQNTFLFSFEKPAWVRLSDYISEKSNVLVYGEPISRISIFTGDNVVIKRPLYEDEFYLDLSSDWQMILLYGEKHPNHYLALRDWYKDFLENRNYTVVWEDKDSYCYQI